MLLICTILLYSLVLAAIAVAYIYFGYPILIYILSRLFGRRPHRPAVDCDDLPTVSLLIAAHNESAEIRKRIENCLGIDYPEGKFEVIIASDGSTDETNSLVEDYAPAGVRLLPFRERRGKSAVLNDSIPMTRGEIVVFSDANTHMHPQSVRQLAAWFAERDTGVVCGRLVLTDPVAGRNVDGLYWKYETFLKKCESRLGALLGSNGGIYAIRKSIFAQIPDNTLVDDFVLPLLAAERSGCRIVYDRDAVACEETPDSMTSEFHRRVRIGAGGFQSIGILRSLFHPRNGWRTFTFVNHKFLRWVCPFIMIYALLASAFLVPLSFAVGGDGEQMLAVAAFGLQIGFYALALGAGFIPNRPRFMKVFRLPAMFTVMNAALAWGFVRWLRGRQRSTWRRTVRASELAMDSPSDTGRHSAAEITSRIPLSDDAMTGVGS